MIEQIREIWNSHIDADIADSKNNFTKNFKRVRKKIFNNFLDFCVKRNIDPLKIKAEDIITFLFVYVTGWQNTASYDIGYTLQRVYTILMIKYKLIDQSILDNVNKSLYLAMKRRTELKKFRYFPLVGELEVRRYYRKLKKTESKIIFLLYQAGLTYKQILTLEVGQIDFKLGCLVVPAKIYGLTIYKERMRRFRLLRFSKKLKTLVREYLSQFDIDIDNLYYKERLLFDGIPKNELFAECTSVAKKFGFSTGNLFLNEFRSLMIVRMHRKSVPIALIMDYMNISKYSVYVGELQMSYLNKVDAKVVTRSLKETFDLSC